MGDITPALVAAASIIGGLVALARLFPRVRTLFRVDQATLLANLRELAATWEAKYDLVSAELVAERTAHAETKESLRDEERAGDRCRRELDAVQSELRSIGRRRSGRTT